MPERTQTPENAASGAFANRCLRSARRAVEWLLVRPLDPPSRSAFDTEQRDCLAYARGADTLAWLAANNSIGPRGGVRMESAILTLQGETAYWALRARAPKEARAGEGGLRGLVDRLGEPALDSYVGVSCAKDLRAALLLSTDQLLALNAADLPTVVERAAAAARITLKSSEDPGVATRALRFRRIGMAIAICAAFAGVVIHSKNPRELAHGKRWHASSGYEGPASGLVWPVDGVFFHTNLEPEPWVVVDIGRHEIQKIVVTNRKDCCQERAVPMVVEVDDAHGGWRAIGRKDTVFDKWSLVFPPVITDRIRIRVAHPTYLHLADVEAY